MKKGLDPNKHRIYEERTRADNHRIYEGLDPNQHRIFEGRTRS